MKGTGLCFFYSGLFTSEAVVSAYIILRSWNPLAIPILIGATVGAIFYYFVGRSASESPAVPAHDSKERKT